MKDCADSDASASGIQGVKRDCGMADIKDTADGSSPPSLVDCIIVFATLIVLLGLAYMLFGAEAAAGPNQIALVFASLVASAVAYKNGLTWPGVRQAVIDGVSSGLSAIFILLAVGALIGAWALSGTIVTMIYFGLKILSPDYFYVSSMAICALLGLAIGSSWTVVGTVGVGLMGVAANLGLSPAVTAAAIISGAYFGDKTSPLSDTVNLATAIAGADLFQHIRETLWTSIPSLLLALLLFHLLGQSGHGSSESALGELTQHFNVSLWAFAPVVFVFALAVLRFPPFVTIFSGALLGCVVAVLLNPDQLVAFANDDTLARPLAMLKGAWMALATGFVSSTGDTATDTLLSRGGMAHMLTTVWLIMAALAFGAIVEHAGLINRLINPIVAAARSTGALVSSVVASSIGANLVTADQYMSIALPARMFRAEFERRGYQPVVLSRAIGDTGSVTSALIPWNSCGAYMSATLAVPVVSYAGFAFFCLLNPLMTILLAWLGWRMLKRPLASEDAGR
jgi:NhaC family Na+:H+ antiporter